MNFWQSFTKLASTTTEWTEQIGPGLLSVLKSIGRLFVYVLEWIVGVMKWLLSLLP